MICRQRSPSTMSFHPDPESGMDDLDVLLIRRIEYHPGINMTNLANSITFYNKDDPSENGGASYRLISYRIKTLEKERLIVTRREPKQRERRCYPY